MNHIFKALQYLILPFESHLSPVTFLKVWQNRKPPVRSDMPGGVLIWSIWSDVRQRPTLTGSTEIFGEWKSVSCKLHQGPRGVLSPATRAPDSSCASSWDCWLVFTVAFQLSNFFFFFFASPVCFKHDFSSFLVIHSCSFLKHLSLFESFQSWNWPCSCWV